MKLPKPIPMPNKDKSITSIMSKTYKVEVTATTVLEVCAENAYDAQTLAMIALNSHPQKSYDHDWYHSVRVLIDTDNNNLLIESHEDLRS